MNKLPLLLAVLLSIMLTSCGGGGGGSSSSENFTLSEDTINFEGDRTFGAPDAQTVIGRVSRINDPLFAIINVQSTSGIESASYGFTGNTDGQLSINPKFPGDLSVGNYTDLIDVSVCFDSSCQRHVNGSPKTVTVHYEVTDTIHIQSLRSLNCFSSVGSTNVVERGRLEIIGENSVWSATPSDSWFSVTQTSGAGPALLFVDVDPTGLPSGTYTEEITITDSVSGKELSEVVNLRIAEGEVHLFSERNIFFFGGKNCDFAPQEVTFEIGQESEYSWSVDEENTSEWLLFDRNSGFIGSDLETIEVTVDATNLTENSYSGTVDIDVDINGDIVSFEFPVIVDLELYPHRIEPRARAIAFTSLSDLENLSHEIIIDSNREMEADWTALVSYEGNDSDWLTITTEGITGDTLFVAADPNSLDSGEMYYVTITLSSTTSSVTNSGVEMIEVGFYVDESVVSSETVIDLTYLS